MSDTSRPWYTPASDAPGLDDIELPGVDSRHVEPEPGLEAEPSAFDAVPSAEPAPAVVAEAPVVLDVAPGVAAAAVAGERGSDDFDRERVLRLLDQLEADITAVEAAMVHAESGDSEAFAAAVASLAPQLRAG